MTYDYSTSLQVKRLALAPLRRPGCGIGADWLGLAAVKERQTEGGIVKEF